MESDAATGYDCPECGATLDRDEDAGRLVCPDCGFWMRLGKFVDPGSKGTDAPDRR